MHFWDRKVRKSQSGPLYRVGGGTQKEVAVTPREQGQASRRQRDFRGLCASPLLNCCRCNQIFTLKAGVRKTERAVGIYKNFIFLVAWGMCVCVYTYLSCWKYKHLTYFIVFLPTKKKPSLCFVICNPLGSSGCNLIEETKSHEGFMGS